MSSGSSEGVAVFGLQMIMNEAQSHIDRANNDQVSGQTEGGSNDSHSRFIWKWSKKKCRLFLEHTYQLALHTRIKQVYMSHNSLKGNEDITKGMPTYFGFCWTLLVSHKKGNWKVAQLWVHTRKENIITKRAEPINVNSKMTGLWVLLSTDPFHDPVDTTKHSDSLSIFYHRTKIRHRAGILFTR